MAPLEFTNVLYVPSLSSNLFSVLYLTMHRPFTISIVKDTLNFIRNGHTVILGKVDCSSNAATFGTDASVTNTLLGSRSGNLVTGFKLDSHVDPDPVCEACKAGKMHSDLFPPSTSRASRPSNLSTVISMAL
jgi:hypothetical protein